jgi:aspartate beta-hydroxylase
MSRVQKLFQMMFSGRAPRSPHPQQRPGLYVPELTGKPWHDTAAFPWVRSLEAAAPAIREEALRARAPFVPYLEPELRPGKSEWELTALHDRGNWDVMYFDLLDRSFDENKRACPVTASVLREIPRITTSSMFSVLSSGTHIQPHCGPSNAFLRVHLGLVVPDGCAMRVGDETRSWEEGKCLVFDDSFEHEVWNRGNASRIVLIFYIYHPDFTDAEVAELEQLRAQAPTGHEALWQGVADDLLKGGRYPKQASWGREESQP